MAGTIAPGKKSVLLDGTHAHLYDEFGTYLGSYDAVQDRAMHVFMRQMLEQQVCVRKQGPAGLPESLRVDKAASPGRVDSPTLSMAIYPPPYAGLPYLAVRLTPGDDRPDVTAFRTEKEAVADNLVAIQQHLCAG